MKIILDNWAQKCYNLLHTLEMNMGRAANNEKGGEDRHKWAQVLLSPDEHKRLKRIALDKDVTLKELLGGVIKNFINKESSYGRTRSRHERST